MRQRRVEILASSFDDSRNRHDYPYWHKLRHLPLPVFIFFLHHWSAREIFLAFLKSEQDGEVASSGIPLFQMTLRCSYKRRMKPVPDQEDDLTRGLDKIQQYDAPERNDVVD